MRSSCCDKCQVCMCLQRPAREIRLSFRYPRHSHAVAGALASGKVGRIVARQMRAKPTNGEVWIERQADLRGGPCLVELAKPRQGRSNAEMPYGIVAIELYAAAQPNHCFKVCVEVHFRYPDKVNPPEGSGIPRGEPKGFPD